jgi:hypothetical protein
VKVEELSTSKYLPFPRELCELTMTFNIAYQQGSSRSLRSPTDKLTATRQFDGCELLFVVFLERRAELGYEGGAFNREGFNIYHNLFRIGNLGFRVVLAPAMTSASLRKSVTAMNFKTEYVPLLEALLPQRRKLWLVGTAFLN